MCSRCDAQRRVDVVLNGIEFDRLYVAGCQCSWCMEYISRYPVVPGGTPVMCRFCTNNQHAVWYAACAQCRDSRTFRHCEVCRNVVPVEPEYGQILGMTIWCNACVENIETHNCTRCSAECAPWTGGSVPYYTGDRICHNCAGEMRRCQICSSYTARRHRVTIGTAARAICPSCYRGGEQCPTCDSYFNPSVSIACSCGTVHQYSYKPTPKFRHSETERRAQTVYFGFELEVTDRKDNGPRAIVSVSNGLLYAKRDASIGAKGFELVSHPFSWKWLRENRKMFRAIFETIARNGVRSSGRCGMHIHVSRAGLKRSALYKVMRLVFNLDNSTFKMLANRKCDMTWINTYCPKSMDNSTMIKKSLGYDNSGGRTAVNANRLDTIEFRMFGSVDTYEDFMRNMEACVSIIDYAKATGIKDISFDSYCAYVRSRSRTFPHIAKTL